MCLKNSNCAPHCLCLESTAGQIQATKMSFCCLIKDGFVFAVSGHKKKPQLSQLAAFVCPIEQPKKVLRTLQHKDRAYYLPKKKEKRAFIAPFFLWCVPVKVKKTPNTKHSKHNAVYLLGR